MDFLARLGFWSGLLLCIPAGFLLLEVLCGLLRQRPLASTRRPARTVVLIPAHDEGAGIGRTLQRLQATGVQDLRVVVIADNCSDDTAQRARDAGAEVLERRDAARRGKPFALQWALQRLAADPPEVVVFLDADCWFLAGTPMALAAQALTVQRPVQCIYLMEGTGLGAFAFRVRNEARLRGLQRLGAPVQITGSGFAVPWELLQRVAVPVGSLVEDALWGWQFCQAGVGARLATDVVVGSVLPEAASAEGDQRRRWEHGILATALRSLPGLLRSALLPPRPTRLLHLLDVLVPPLALLVLLILGSFGLGLAAGGVASALPAATALFLVAAAVFIGWAAYGRSQLPIRSLLLLPMYVVKKIGLYVSFLFKRESEWVRTKRDGDDAKPDA